MIFREGDKVKYHKFDYTVTAVDEWGVKLEGTKDGRPAEDEPTESELIIDIREFEGTVNGEFLSETHFDNLASRS